MLLDTAWAVNQLRCRVVVASVTPVSPVLSIMTDMDSLDDLPSSRLLKSSTSISSVDDKDEQQSDLYALKMGRFRPNYINLIVSALFISVIINFGYATAYYNIVSAVEIRTTSQSGNLVRLYCKSFHRRNMLFS